jgi:hypothetical protein
MKDRKLLDTKVVETLNYRIQQEEIGKAVQLIDIHNLTADLLVLDSYVKENLLD